ncbi:YIP1 family protein [Paenibacillus alkaliterrae]|uniref:YIP1 family protein n=1 Tax=Paenibacillus alkaliterrae TaxID=320909 RepID=UPI001F1D766C|nr:YIP1 family protein [Paenibacillus alkaliterrae]MCF2940919.1 YIP1 family protein [Paenibacillus alkaliterrae]
MVKFKFILFIAIIMLLLPSTAFANAPYITFTINHDGEPILTQSAYLPTGVVDGFNITEKDTGTGEEKSVPLSRPEDLFIDSKDRVYVADTGNARIVVFDQWGNYLQTIGQDTLSKPTGVFVDEEGAVYVADYGHEKVFIFNQDGKVRKEFGKPDSHLFGKNNPFKPTKVIADKRKNLFVVGEGTIHGLIQISQEGEFLGYFGGNKTGFNLTKVLQRTFYTQAQRDQLMKQLPPSATNVAVDSEGLVYTSTVGTRDDSIKKLNVAGKNLLPDLWSYPDIADITVDALGNIYAVDSFRGRVIEYDRDGNILFIFGGTDEGSQRLGLFKSPSGIAVSSDGRLFIVDKQRNNIQILQATEFTTIVHEALFHFADGKYAQSEGPWIDVLRLNSMFDLAHTGLGMSAMKQGEYETALEEFRVAGNKEEYSNAYWEIRRMWLMAHTSKYMIGIVLLIAAVIVMKKLYRKYGFAREAVDGWQRFKQRKLAAQLLHPFRLMRHPVDGYYELEAEGKSSVLSATILLIMLFVVRVFVIYETNFLFADWDVIKVNLFTEFLKVYIPFFAWVISNYLVSSINDGEGKFKDIYKGSVYALSPYILFAGPVAIMSQGLTRLEVVLYDFASASIVLYSVFLLFMMVKEIHGYELGQTVKNIFLTLIGMLIMALLAFILFGLSNQVTDFIYSIFQEVKYRVEN